MLLVTGWIVMSGLCSFNCAFSFGFEGFFWTRIFLCFSKRLLCIVAVFSVRVFLYLLVGFLESKGNFFAARNVCTLFEYSAGFIITNVLPLSYCKAVQATDYNMAHVC